MRENTNQKNSKYGHFLRSVIVNRDGLSKINFATFCENNYRLKNRPKVSYSLNIDHVVGDSIPWSQSFSDPVLFYQPWKACSDFWISVQYYPIQTLSKLKERMFRKSYSQVFCTTNVLQTMIHNDLQKQYSFADNFSEN